MLHWNYIAKLAFLGNISLGLFIAKQQRWFFESFNEFSWSLVLSPFWSLIFQTSLNLKWKSEGKFSKTVPAKQQRHIVQGLKKLWRTQVNPVKTTFMARNQRQWNTTPLRTRLKGRNVKGDSYNSPKHLRYKHKEKEAELQSESENEWAELCSSFSNTCLQVSDIRFQTARKQQKWIKQHEEAAFKETLDQSVMWLWGNSQVDEFDFH